MIRVKGLITSIKANLLISRNVFPHKIQQSWENEFIQQNPKYNYLEQLLQTNQIRPYFIEKDIKQLEKEDIFFYMQNKQLFHKLPKNKIMQLMKNPNANTIMKFHLALQIKTLKNSQVQIILLEQFNKSISTMSSKNLIFCLELICNFNNVSESINYYELEKKIMSEQDPQIYINLIYLLSILQFPLQMIQKQQITQKMSMLENINIPSILYLNKISKFYQIQLTPYIQNRLRSSFAQKRKHFAQQEGQFIVQMLHYYPQSANALDIQCLNTQSYISYLQFFLPQKTEQPTNIQIPRIIPHSIPINIVKNAQVNQFYNIVKTRMALQIDTPQSLVNDLKKYYTNSLSCIISIIRFLDKQQKLSAQVQSTLQKSLLRQIIKNSTKAFEQYKITDIFKVFGYLSVNNLGTINFWKKCLKFVTNAIQDAQIYKNLTGEEQKKFVVYVFQIFKSKPFPRQLQDQIINLTLLSLTYNRWSIKQILSLTISLKVNRIADNELWFGIQQRINQTNIKYTEFNNDDRKALKKIVYNFNTIGKGSYEFWSEINKHLNKVEKQQILNGFKIPSTMAHTYLKV